MTDRLTSIENKLENIQQTLNVLAVQSEQISSMQIQIDVLWRKYDMLTDPKSGVLTKLQIFQAACPKGMFQTHVKWVWLTLIPLLLTQIGIAVKLLLK